ncbi:MAG: polysaccharide biosynthesis/export family protein [Bacteroidota bacterium]|nr:polysaccharide biosynthesis/export family protein [Bacteroidota bacterium]
MKHSPVFFFRLFIVLIAGAVLFSSCVPQKKIKYLQLQEAAGQKDSFSNERKIEYKIQPGDNLYIKVVSIDEKTSALFNTSDIRSSYAMNTDAGIYLNSYTVSENGNVDFPLIGSVEVKNLTVAEVKDKLQLTLNEYLKESVVIVKMVNFYVTMLGEVRRPGEYKIYQDELNIFEAISLAGDLTDFANRNEVKLIRQTKDGSKVIGIDMTDADILASDYYYMMPNDIIYVEPLKGKQFTFANFPYGIIFSAISTTLLLINYFK